MTNENSSYRLYHLPAMLKPMQRIETELTGPNVRPRPKQIWRSCPRSLWGRIETTTLTCSGTCTLAAGRQSSSKTEINGDENRNHWRHGVRFTCTKRNRIVLAEIELYGNKILSKKGAIIRLIFLIVIFPNLDFAEQRHFPILTMQQTRHWWRLSFLKENFF